MKYDIEQHLLPLEGAGNARDLGGYETKDGRHTKKNVFIRCDNTNQLTQKDLDYLASRNLALAVDLRSPEELVAAPSVFETQKDIAYKNVTMLDHIHSSLFQGTFPDSMGELYIKMLEGSKIGFGRVFQLFLKYSSDGACLFHCSAGKDRTGLVAMLLLESANIDDDIIIADYAATQVFQEEARNLQLALLHSQNLDVPEHILLSEPRNMEMALSHLRLRYGGARGYLKECGIKSEDLDTLVQRFVEI